MFQTISEQVQEMGRFRLALHSTLYNDSRFIENLITSLNELDLFTNITYNIESKCIVMRIKKTNMKKHKEFNHDTRFYYSVLHDFARNFMSLNIDKTRSIAISIYNDPVYVDSRIIPLYLSNIGLLFNITVLSDNIININL